MDSKAVVPLLAGVALASSAATYYVSSILCKKKCAEHKCEHWLPGVERVGVLGDLVTRANHYAITVSDVAKSLDFYANVLGLQQIRRPNFDRHGAWLTAGNIEIHLIKGPPVVPQGDHLIVGHLSLETDVRNIDEVLRRLKAHGVPFKKNISVPNRSESGVVTQFFLRDPDGYFVEICNCDILTKFCLSQDDERVITYNESNVDLGVAEIMRLHAMAEHSRVKHAQRLQEKPESLVLPPGQRAKFPDPVILQNMLARTRIWGDLMQGETKESIGCALMEAGNSVPLATRIIRARKAETGQVYVPPAVFEGGDVRYQPRAVQRRQVVLDRIKTDVEAVMEVMAPDQLFTKIFDRMDKDKSGALERAEVAFELRRLCPMSKESDIDRLLGAFDADGSSTLDRGEFVTMCSELSARSSKAKWMAIFELCDDDGNGRITAPELCHKLSDLGVMLADDELDELFMDMDVDGDGSISREELVQAMTADFSAVAGNGGGVKQAAPPALG